MRHYDALDVRHSDANSSTSASNIVAALKHALNNNMMRGGATAGEEADVQAHAEEQEDEEEQEASAGSGSKAARSLKKHKASDETITPEELVKQAEELYAGIPSEAHMVDRVDEAMCNQKMKVKSMFVAADHHGSGLVFEHVFREVFKIQHSKLKSGLLDLETLMCIVHPYRCSSNPAMIEYGSFIDFLWPSLNESAENEEERSKEGSAAAEKTTQAARSSAAEMEKLKERARQLSVRLEAELARLGGSSSDDIEKLAVQLAAKADELYVNVVQDLGGVQAIQQYKQKSSQLQGEIKRRLGQTIPWRHDFIIHHLGLNGLIRVGQRVIKPIFDTLVERTAQKFGAVALIADVKGPERAGVKVRTQYGGDATR
jgi:hypothetical protein